MTALELITATAPKNLDVHSEFMHYWHLLATLNSKHTCTGSKQTHCETANTQSWLRWTVPKHLFVTWDTEVCEIINCMELLYMVCVNQEAAQLTCVILIQDWLEHQQEQFCQIPAYLALYMVKTGFYTFICKQLLAIVVIMHFSEFLFVLFSHNFHLFRCENLW